jgi:hypothetical protein
LEEHRQAVAPYLLDQYVNCRQGWQVRMTLEPLDGRQRQNPADQVLPDRQHDIMTCC